MTAPASAVEADSIPQGDLRLLDTDTARRLLASTIPARLAYVATDGTPRVVPTWFEWTGEEIVMATYLAGPASGIRHPAARVAALRANPTVALTIDTETSPPNSITVRGRAEIDEINGLAPEYVSAAHRYLGDAADAMLAAMDQPGTVQARIAVRPTWVGVLDFSRRLPSPLGGVQEVAS
jgi:Pyridoxamine 5'-phosphate oxidase